MLVGCWGNLSETTSCLTCERTQSIISKYNTRVSLADYRTCPILMFFADQTGIYADCEEGTVSVGGMSRAQGKDILRSVKSTIVDECDLKVRPVS
jgi:hypothetical protein